MSYSGIVICRCYQDGITAKPPYEEYVVFDENGLNIDYPYPDNDQNWDDFYQKDTSFKDWKSNSCQHKDMEFVDEFLTNSSGMAAFRVALQESGGVDKFPTIIAELPTCNGGCMSADKAKKVLEELEIFEKSNQKQTKIYLRNTGTDHIIAICEEDSHSIFAFFAKDYCYALDKNGFFILRREIENERELHYEVFRSNNFRIVNDANKRTTVINQNSIQRFTGAIPLEENIEYPSVQNYNVKIKQEQVSDYCGYITEPLRKLVEGSIATGNPIHWC